MTRVVSWMAGRRARPRTLVPGAGHDTCVRTEQSVGQSFRRGLLRGLNESEHGAFAAYFGFLELGSGDCSVESRAQLLGGVQRQLDPGARTNVEVRVDEVERDDVAERSMARVVIGNHRLR